MINNAIEDTVNIQKSIADYKQIERFTGDKSSIINELTKIEQELNTMIQDLNTLKTKYKNNTNNTEVINSIYIDLTTIIIPKYEDLKSRLNSVLTASNNLIISESAIYAEKQQKILAEQQKLTEALKLLDDELAKLVLIEADIQNMLTDISTTRQNIIDNSKQMCDFDPDGYSTRFKEKVKTMSCWINKGDNVYKCDDILYKTEEEANKACNKTRTTPQIWYPATADDFPSQLCTGKEIEVGGCAGRIYEDYRESAKYCQSRGVSDSMITIPIDNSYSSSDYEAIKAFDTMDKEEHYNTYDLLDNGCAIDYCGFDYNTYTTRYDDVSTDIDDANRHWLNIGMQAGRDPCPN